MYLSKRFEFFQSPLAFRPGVGNKTVITGKHPGVSIRLCVTFLPPHLKRQICNRDMQNFVVVQINILNQLTCLIFQRQPSLFSINFISCVKNQSAVILEGETVSKILKKEKNMSTFMNRVWHNIIKF